MRIIKWVPIVILFSLSWAGKQHLPNIKLKDLDKNGFVEIIGSMDDIDENIIMSAISNVINNQTLIYNKKLKLSKLVDGNGVHSVVNWLIGNLSNQYCLNMV